MSDYSREMFMDPTVTIKTEPILSDGTSLMITSASVPIPSRNEYRDYGIEVETSQSPVYQLALPGTYEGNMWGGSILNADEMLKSEALIMDEDDIFQVDKADLLQDPTLAELNANDENLLGDFNFDDLLLPEEGSYASLAKAGLANNNPLGGACSLPNTSLFFYREINQPTDRHTLTTLDKNKTPISTLSPNSPTSSTSSLQHSGTSPSHIGGPQKHSTLHELLMKREAYGSSDSCQLGQSVPSRPMLVTSPNTKVQRGLSRLSTSAPTHLGFEQIWQRREPKIRQISTSSLVEAGSTSSLSTGGILSPDPQDLSHDEFDSDEDSEGHYEDYSTDNDSDEEREPNSQRSGSKKERFFWQYNVQAKGPKGQRLVMKSKMEDPHVLNEAQDPVFSSECSVRGIKHSGKARKGDGNDLTPNARKLYAIGRELDKLGRIINDMTPVSELPFNVRPTSRKEKNKLASRACRLKKKAQHEANKIKLSGLEVEHKRLLSGIAQVKQILMTKLNERDKLSLEQQDELTKNIEKIAKGTQKYKVAGHTTEYVNKILDKAKGGGMTVLLEDM